MMVNKCIIAISHSDYLCRNAGTEKCMREAAGILKERGIHYFQIFSFEDNSRLNYLCNMQGKVGVNYDKKFLGIYKYGDLPGLTQTVRQKYKINFTGVHVHNVLNHDYDALNEYLNEINLPIIAWIHDYASVCPESPILLKNGEICCSNFGRDLKVCGDCRYKEKAVAGQERIKEFYKKIDDKIEAVLVPSNNVKRNILTAYPDWNSRIFIRGHLKFFDKKEKNGLGRPLRIAFAGGGFIHKGIKEWEELVKHYHKNKEYELYYLGSSDREKREGVTSIFVDASVQGAKAMSEAALKNKIDAAFLWSKCQETYSYTYYEMRGAGARILTCSASGNIAESVKLENSGIVFNDIQELIDLMAAPDKFRKRLEGCTNSYYSEYALNDCVDILLPSMLQDRSTQNYGDTQVREGAPIREAVPHVRKYMILSLLHEGCNLCKKLKARRKLRAD